MGEKGGLRGHKKTIEVGEKGQGVRKKGVDKRSGFEQQYWGF